MPAGQDGARRRREVPQGQDAAIQRTSARHGTCRRADVSGPNLCPRTPPQQLWNRRFPSIRLTILVLPSKFDDSPMLRRARSQPRLARVAEGDVSASTVQDEADFPDVSSLACFALY